METTQESSFHVVIVPTPGMGHLIPLIEFAKRVVDFHKFAVTFSVPNDGSPKKLQRQLLLALPETISSIFLPPVSFEDLPEDAKNESRIVLSLTRSLHLLKDSLMLDQMFSCEYRDLPEPINLPGCVPFCERDIADSLQADIYNPNQFERAIQGCEYVCHVATPTVHDTQSSMFEDTIEAAVAGVRSTADSCIRSQSVK
ncbi:hypothetical protein CRYUN_Cryun13aG0109600 [Craigia yunnanensis]